MFSDDSKSVGLVKVGFSLQLGGFVTKLRVVNDHNSIACLYQKLFIEINSCEKKSKTSSFQIVGKVSGRENVLREVFRYQITT